MTDLKQATNPKAANIAPPPRDVDWMKPLIWVVGILLAVLVFVIVLGTDATEVDPEIDAIEIGVVEGDGVVLPPLTSPDPTVGSPAPVFEAQSPEGITTTYGNDGTARLYMFVSHRCAVCQTELPEIATWLATNPLPADVELLAISTAIDPDGTNYPPSQWFTVENWQAPVAVDDAKGSLFTAFGLEAVPFWVAVDADGNVVERRSGQQAPADLVELVEVLSDGA